MTDAHGGKRPEGGPAGMSGARPPRPSGAEPRPRRARREQTRTALLTAAERLWAERGIHGASLDDIAAAAGLTKGAVYSNFAGKTDLLLALMESITSNRTRTDVCEELNAAQEEAAPTGRSSSRHDTGDAPRRLALLLVEFWLYGMRDYAAGWRIADWYAERRAQLASELDPAGGLPPGDRATLTMALDFGLAFQHLLDPARVPMNLYKTGKSLMQAPHPTDTP
jgi:AcrR family transcriptional regulator